MRSTIQRIFFSVFFVLFSFPCGVSAATVDPMLDELDKRDLHEKTCENLRIMRNEIYARHGRRFNDPELQEYFFQQKWYRPKFDPDQFPQEKITIVQARNIEYIQH